MQKKSYPGPVLLSRIREFENFSKKMKNVKIIT